MREDFVDWEKWELDKYEFIEDALKKYIGDYREFVVKCYAKETGLSEEEARELLSKYRFFNDDVTLREDIFCMALEGTCENMLPEWEKQTNRFEDILKWTKEFMCGLIYDFVIDRMSLEENEDENFENFKDFEDLI